MPKILHYHVYKFLQFECTIYQWFIMKWKLQVHSLIQCSVALRLFPDRRFPDRSFPDYSYSNLHRDIKADQLNTSVSSQRVSLWTKYVHSTSAEMIRNDWNIPHVPWPCIIAPLMCTFLYNTHILSLSLSQTQILSLRVPNH